MIKISANISKKVPITGTEFSSQQFGASMEVEVSDADQPENIQARIRGLYAAVTQAVDEQIAAATGGNGGNGHGPARENVSPPPPPTQPPAAPVRDGCAGNRTGSASGNGKKTGTTDAQRRAIYAICKSLNLDMATVLADFNVTDASQLSVKDASRLIDDLKSRQATSPAQQPRR